MSEKHVIDNDKASRAVDRLEANIDAVFNSLKVEVGKLQADLEHGDNIVLGAESGDKVTNLDDDHDIDISAAALICSQAIREIVKPKDLADVLNRALAGLGVGGGCVAV